jgi:succinate dehydrogenase hydrophobic anchor subunit
MNTNTNTKRSTWGWFWQSVTGLLLIFLVGLHMFAHHFIVEGGLRDFQQVLDYMRNPLILVTEIAFLITVTVHAVLGMRSILFDLGLSDRAERAVTVAGWVIGGMTILYGFWLTYTILITSTTPTAVLFP